LKFLFDFCGICLFSLIFLDAKCQTYIHLRFLLFILDHLLSVVSLFKFFKQNSKEEVKQHLLGDNDKGYPPGCGQGRVYCSIKVVKDYRLTIISKDSECGKNRLHHVVEVIHRGMSIHRVKCQSGRVDTCHISKEGQTKQDVYVQNQYQKQGIILDVQQGFVEIVQK